jgi:hypothetical protein
MEPCAPSAQSAGQREPCIAHFSDPSFPLLRSVQVQPLCSLWRPPVQFRTAKMGRFGTKTKNAQASGTLHQGLPTKKTVRPSQISRGLSAPATSPFEPLRATLDPTIMTPHTDLHGWRFLSSSLTQTFSILCSLCGLLFNPNGTFWYENEKCSMFASSASATSSKQVGTTVPLFFRASDPSSVQVRLVE